MRPCRTPLGADDYRVVQHTHAALEAPSREPTFLFSYGFNANAGLVHVPQSGDVLHLDHQCDTTQGCSAPSLCHPSASSRTLDMNHVSDLFQRLPLSNFQSVLDAASEAYEYNTMKQTSHLYPCCTVAPITVLRLAHRHFICELLD